EVRKAYLQSNFTPSAQLAYFLLQPSRRPAYDAVMAMKYTTKIVFNGEKAIAVEGLLRALDETDWIPTRASFLTPFLRFSMRVGEKMSGLMVQTPSVLGAQGFLQLSSAGKKEFAQQLINKPDLLIYV